jgi:hypothetical protein
MLFSALLAQFILILWQYMLIDRIHAVEVAE